MPKKTTMAPNKVVEALKNIEKTFYEAQQRIKDQKVTNELLKNQIEQEKRETLMMEQKIKFLQEKESMLKELSQLLEPEIEQVQETKLQIEQEHEKLNKYCEMFKRLDREHIERISERDSVLKHFIATKDERLKKAADDVWFEHRDKLKELEDQKADLETKLNNLKFNHEKMKEQNKIQHESLREQLMREEKKMKDHAQAQIARLNQQNQKNQELHAYNMANIEQQGKFRIDNLKAEIQNLTKRQSELAGHLAQFERPVPRNVPSSSRGVKRKNHPVSDTYMQFLGETEDK